MDDMSENDLAAHLRQLEQRLHDPQVRGSVFLTSELLDADFTEIGSSGQAYGRADTIAALAAEAKPAGPSVRSENYQLKRLSETVALLTCETAGEGRHVLRSSIWRRTNGHWRMVFHQGTLKKV
ncbi:hypothetical protein ASE23_01750 [Rhizobium sp. Root73]|uniref:nuclear transport factor 2 family protein n=1 Tax=unclassified Rhizobium TaxID=2613769 RepID=UPI000714B70B|nr:MULTISPECIES: DUF4440 domain-containing protein [unclassified Rhizobium]KQV37397.1 hypothetical protein ASC96_04850 [Rhizobium sp. Root1204]KQY17409.1 hypothetical protein ASD36_01750 [Rhizobium sp. Root1334]KRC13292.1 hypothetical protein ASE23_01750 [Rhizobium sp. Root73]